MKSDMNMLRRAASRYFALISAISSTFHHITNGQSHALITTINKLTILITQFLLVRMPRPETVISARSSRRPFWSPWFSVVLGLLCFPRLGLCQTPIVYGQTSEGSLTSPGQRDHYSFAGITGKSVSVQMYAPNFYEQIQLYAPD